MTLQVCASSSVVEALEAKCLQPHISETLKTSSDKKKNPLLCEATEI